MKLENTAYKVIFSGQAPGLFFMVFGSILLCVYLWTMRPQKEIVAAQAEATRAGWEQVSTVLLRAAELLSQHFQSPKHPLASSPASTVAPVVTMPSGEDPTLPGDVLVRSVQELSNGRQSASPSAQNSLNNPAATTT